MGGLVEWLMFLATVMLIHQISKPFSGSLFHFSGVSKKSSKRDIDKCIPRIYSIQITVAALRFRMFGNINKCFTHTYAGTSIGIVSI